MTDPQQTHLVARLEAASDEAQMARNSAEDRCEIAQHQFQLPNRFRWRRHGVSFLFAGLLSLGGALYALDREAPFMVPMAAGSGLSLVLASKALDDRRQTRDKREWLDICRYELVRTEQALRQATLRYREEEENRWLMYALDIRKEELLALRQWMADPRRTMKDALLEATDVVTEHFLQQPLHNAPTGRVTLERDYRQLRLRLLSPDLQLQKDEFLAQVFAKHQLARDHELKRQAFQSEVRVKSTAIAGGTAAGMLAGAGVTALGANLASTLGQSKALMATTLTSAGSMAAVVGVGLLAAGTLHGWMSKAEGERRQREAQQYHDAFLITTQILEDVLDAQTALDPVEQRQQLQTAWERLEAFRRKELKLHDAQLKEFAALLDDRLQAYLNPSASQPLLGKMKTLLHQMWA